MPSSMAYWRRSGHRSLGYKERCGSWLFIIVVVVYCCCCLLTGNGPGE